MGKRIPRIRRRGDYIKTSGTRQYYPSNPLSEDESPHVHEAVFTNTTRKVELMWDTTGFEDCDFNPCWHEKALKTGETPVTQEPRIQPTSHPPNMYTWSGGGHNVDQLAAGRSIPLDLGQWLDDFAANATYHFQTAVEPAASLINFLIEAIQICELNIKVLKDLWEGILKALKRFNEMLAQTGNFWLSWNFAIKPTIRDIKVAFETLKKAQKRLKWLRERNHKNTKVKYREGPREFTGTCVVPHLRPSVGAQLHPSPGTMLGSEPDLDPNVELEVAYQAKIQLTSWAWIRFDIDDAYLDDFYGLGIIMMVMQGLYNPGAIIWEATPFSWLIDWFRTQKSKLEQLIATDLSPLKDGTILSTGWTIHAVIHGDCTWVINRDTDAEERRDAGAVMYQLHSRQPGLPSAGSSPFQVPTSWYQLSIILALIQQFRRRK